MSERCEHGVWIGDLCYACEREKNADDVARLRRQVDEAVECCIIKDNRNLRLEIDLANVSGMLVEAWTLMVDGKVADDFGDRLQQWIDSRQPSEKRVTTRPTDSASVPPLPPTPPPARDVTGRTGPPVPPKNKGSNWIPRGYHMRGKP